jgi:hypothetical protein
MAAERLVMSPQARPTPGSAAALRVAGGVRCIDAMDSSFDSIGITVPESLPQEQYKEESK